MKIRAISIRTTISLLMAIMLTILIIVVSITVNAFLTNAIADIMIRSTTDIITQINNNAETYINDITGIAAYARNLARDTSALNAEGITERLKTIVELMAKRAKFYKNADLIVKTDNTTPLQNVEIILKYLKGVR